MPDIQLAATVAYVSDGCPSHNDTRYQRVYDEFNAAIDIHGLPAVKKHIHQLTGQKPLVTKVWPSGSYFFKKACRTVQVDFEVQYVTSPDYYTLRVTGALGGLPRHSVGDYGYVLLSADHPHYGGIPLYRWIEQGYECPDCGTLHLGEQEICPRCLEAYECRNYSHRVEDELGMEDTKAVRFGVELEYERITARDVFKTLKGHALPKRDGSIHNGVEIVTRPASIATHKEKLQSFYDQIKVRPESNTGMHVHIERAKLSQFQIGFMMQFLNTPELVPFITVVAGREYANNTYCRVQPDHKMTYGVYFDTADWKLKRSNTDKYSPFNTAKTHTVEIRIFSSPADHEECAAKLDFVAALVDYSSPYSVSVKTLKDKFDWKMFLNYIERNKSQYKDFVNYFIRTNRFEEAVA